MIESPHPEKKKLDGSYIIQTRQQQQETEQVEVGDEQIAKIESNNIGALAGCDSGSGGGSGESSTNAEPKPTKPKSQQTSSAETKAILIARQLDCKITCKFDNHNRNPANENNNNKPNILKSSNNKRENIIISEQTSDPINTNLHNINCELEHNNNQQLLSIPNWVLLVLKKSLADIRAQRCLQIQQQEQKQSTNCKDNHKIHLQHKPASDQMDPSHDVSSATSGQQHSKTRTSQNCLKINQQQQQQAQSVSIKKRKLTPKIVKKRISKIISPKTSASDTKQRDESDASADNKSKGFYFAGFGSHETNYDFINNDLSTNCDSMRRYDNYYYHWPQQDASTENRANKTRSLCPEMEKAAPSLQQAFLSTSLQKHRKHYYISTAHNQSAPSSFSVWSTPRVFPNNTLIADLSQCHPDSIHQLPDLGLEATSKSLMFSLNQCWKPTKEHHHSLQKQQQHRQQQTSQVTPSNSNISINHDESNQQHQLGTDVSSGRRKSFSQQDDYCNIPIESETTTATRARINDNLRLRLDLMIPKSTNSLPASLMSQLDAQSLLRLQQSNQNSYNSNESHLNSTTITPNSNQTQTSEINNDKKINYKTESGSDSKRTRKRKVKFEMPEVLLGARVRLKRDDYDKALCVLTSDFRYQLHLILYSRIQSLWLLISTILCMFIPFVFMVPELSVLVMSAALWFLLQLVGGIATFAVRKRLNRMLERAVAQANSYFMDHNLMLGVINLGGIFAKSKLMVPLVYFDTTPCRFQIESVLGSQGADKSKLSNTNESSTNSANGISFISNNLKHSSDEQLATSGASGLALAKSQMAKKIVLKYSQRWISQYDRRKLIFSGDEDDQIEPRHLSTGKCICQFFEAQYLGAKAAAASSSTTSKTKLGDLRDVTVDGVGRELKASNDEKQGATICLRDQLQAASPISDLGSRQTTITQTNKKLEQMLSTLHHRTSHQQQSQQTPGTHANHYERHELAATDKVPTQGLGGSNQEASASVTMPSPSEINEAAPVGTTPRLSDRVTKAIGGQLSASRSLQQAAAISRPTITTHQQELLADPSMRQVQQMGFSQLALMSSP